MSKSKFDELYEKTMRSLGEAIDDEMMDDESPLEQEGDGEFDDKKQDFPEGEAEEESKEMDLVDELKSMIERMQEIVDQFEDTHSEESPEEESEEAGLAADMDMGDEPIKEESETKAKPLACHKKLPMQVICAVKAEKKKAKASKEQKPLKKTNLGPSNSVKAPGNLQAADKEKSNAFTK